MPEQIAAPKDTPYLATIRLNVDATNIERHIFKIRKTIPVRAGEPLVLLYPQWLPGNHSPSGRVEKLAGLTIYANGAGVEWVRDPVDVFAFHVGVPAGATTLECQLPIRLAGRYQRRPRGDDARYVEFSMERGNPSILPAILCGKSGRVH